MPRARLTDQIASYEVGGQGFPTLLIAGLGSTLRVWDPIRGEMSKHFHLIAADHRGMGGSTAIRRPRHLSHLSGDYIELLDYLHVDKAHVVGLSLGGIIAQRLAMEHADRVERLVLISCAHRFGPYLREVMRLIGQTLRHFPIKQFDRAMRVLGSSPSSLDGNTLPLDQPTGDALGRKARKAIIEQLRCLHASQPGEDEPYRITVPTLVVAGEFDGLIPHCYSRAMAEAIPGAAFELLNGVGHNPVSECPGRLCEVMKLFLNPHVTEDQPEGQRNEPSCQAA